MYKHVRNMRLLDLKSRKNDYRQNTNYMATEASSVYELHVRLNAFKQQVNL